jgi:hypothetical protein
VTFYIDLDDDGVYEKTMSLPANNGAVASGGQSLQKYYDQIVKDLAVSDPGADPSKIVIKVTAYSPTQGELNFHLTGNESQSGDQDDTDEDEDDHGHGGHGGGHHGGGRGHHGGGRGNDHHNESDNDDEDNSDEDQASDGHSGHGHSDGGSCDKGGKSGEERHGGQDQDADYYEHLSSDQSGSHDDVEEDEEEDRDSDLMFC